MLKHFKILGSQAGRVFGRGQAGLPDGGAQELRQLPPPTFHFSPLTSTASTSSLCFHHWRTAALSPDSCIAASETLYEVPGDQAQRKETGGEGEAEGEVREDGGDSRNKGTERVDGGGRDEGGCRRDEARARKKKGGGGWVGKEDGRGKDGGEGQ